MPGVLTRVCLQADTREPMGRSRPRLCRSRHGSGSSGSQGPTGREQLIRKCSNCLDVRAGPQRRLSAEELMLSKCGAGEDSWESLELQEDQTSPS